MIFFVATLLLLLIAAYLLLTKGKSWFDLFFLAICIAMIIQFSLEIYERTR